MPACSPNLLLPFGDADQVSPWAADALRRAVDRGILSGRGGGVLDPTGTATRGRTDAEKFFGTAELSQNLRLSRRFE